MHVGQQRRAGAVEIGVPVDGRPERHCQRVGVRPLEPAGVEADFNGPDEGNPTLDRWTTTAHDFAADRSDLVILDAQDFAGEPVATVHLPQRVPFGFHGNWIPDA